jgi:hypothetical protein
LKIVGDPLDETNDATLDLRVRDLHECFGECKSIRGCKKIGDVRRRGHIDVLGASVTASLQFSPILVHLSQLSRLLDPVG